jgi:hypothetical protein
MLSTSLLHLLLLKKPNSSAEELEAANWRLSGNKFEQGRRVYSPVYEAKLIGQFNHRAATFAETAEEARFGTHAGTNLTELVQLNNPAFQPLPRYWLDKREVTARAEGKKWFVAIRRIISAVADARSVIASIVPTSAIGNTLTLIWSNVNHNLLGVLVTSFNSFVFDYILRQKASGDLNVYVFEQLPVLSPEEYRKPVPWSTKLNLFEWVIASLMELTYTANDLRPFAQDCGYHGPPFRWDEERRFLLRCELDAAYFHLYGIGREDVAYIMDTFPIVRRKDEKAHGEYRTKRVILEIYDEMAESMEVASGQVASGKSYQTRLDPPPAHPDAAHPWDEVYLGPERPREQWWEEGKAEGGRQRAEGGGQKEEKGSLRFSSVADARDAESDLIIYAALRFDAYRYEEETGYDGTAAASRFIEHDSLPNDPAQQMSILFFLQRATKDGYQADNGSVFRAIRTLLPLISKYDVPETFRYQNYYPRWTEKYAPDIHNWIDFIQRIHQLMPYDENATVFDNTDLTAAYRDVIEPIQYDKAISKETTSTVREPAPKLELKRPAASKPKAEKPGFSKKPGFLEAQPTLVTDFTPPAGGYGQRLKRVMALGQPKNQADLAELIAALGDENDNIRWLAGSSLARLGGLAVVKLLAAYLAANPGATSRAEAVKVLGLIADTAEDEAVQAAARQAMKT